MRRFLLLSAALGLATADVHHYQGSVVAPPVLIYHVGGQYAPEDAPASYPPGNGRSFIKFSDLKFTRQKRVCTKEDDFCPGDAQYKDTAAMDVAILEHRHYGKVGVKMDNEATYYCCTERAISVGACNTTHLGHMLCSTPSGKCETEDGLMMVAQVTLPPLIREENSTAPTEAVFETTSKYPVTKTGYYYLFMSACDRDAGEVVVHGQTVWMNPWGYLPGTEWGNLPFFGSMAIIYLFIGLVWTVLMFRFMQELIAVQFWISLVLLLAMIETAAKYFAYDEWNMSGSQHLGGMMFALLVGISKQALSRVLVLMVSTGYGIVKPSLGDMLYGMLALGGLYFIFALGQGLMVKLPAGDATIGSSSWAYSSFLFLIILVQSTIDVTFYAWILQELTNTIQYLKQRRQEIKLKLFRRFRAVLILSAVFSVAWAITTVALVRTKDREQEHWKIQWALDAVWEVCYLVIFIGMCILWRPSANSQRYMYSVQLGTEEDPFDDDEGTGVGIEEVVVDKGEEDDEEYGGAMQDLLPSLNGSTPGKLM
uniref:Transmembrane protein 87A n=1 Tax=Pinguiococcus pyrenoidosus TaxID=172671 RepID=A0A6U0UN44_9STRA|mmetsp:Transcript_1758/g.7629  ORF Transcript_1758/g.7629 Transcript_1758/m.7629 type:complete len:538 (+) Transcript_1758:131-1744(+)